MKNCNQFFHCCLLSLKICSVVLECTLFGDPFTGPNTVGVITSQILIIQTPMIMFGVCVYMFRESAICSVVLRCFSTTVCLSCRSACVEFETRSCLRCSTEVWIDTNRIVRHTHQQRIGSSGNILTATGSFEALRGYWPMPIETMRVGRGVSGTLGFWVSSVVVAPKLVAWW